MNTVTREHKAGLELALHSGAITSPDMQEIVRKMIAQASAAPDQEPVAWVDPVALDSAGPVYDAGFRDGCAESKRLNAHADPSEVLKLREQASDNVRWKAVATEQMGVIEAATPHPVSGEQKPVLWCDPEALDSEDRWVRASRRQSEVVSTPLYVAPPAAQDVSVHQLQMADIVRAIEAVPGAPMLSSNMCWQIAQALNAHRAQAQGSYQ